MKHLSVVYCVGSFSQKKCFKHNLDFICHNVECNY